MTDAEILPEEIERLTLLAKHWPAPRQLDEQLSEAIHALGIDASVMEEVASVFVSAPGGADALRKALELTAGARDPSAYLLGLVSSMIEQAKVLRGETGGGAQDTSTVEEAIADPRSY